MRAAICSDVTGASPSATIILAAFARRGPTRYEQLALIKRRHGFRELTCSMIALPSRATLRASIASGAVRRGSNFSIGA